MSLTPHNATGPVGTERRQGDVYSYEVGSKAIAQGWLVGIALTGADKGLLVPCAIPAEGDAPTVRFLGQADTAADPGARCDVYTAVTLLPLAAGEDTSDPTLFVGVKCFAWDHSTITVEGETAVMPCAGIIRELDPSGEYAWVDMKIANI